MSNFEGVVHTGGEFSYQHYRLELNVCISLEGLSGGHGRQETRRNPAP